MIEEKVQAEFELNERKTAFVEKELMNMFLGKRFSSDLLDPFLAKWKGILYYERNRSPNHYQYLQFVEKMAIWNNDVVGNEAAIKYFVFINKGYIPIVSWENYEVTVSKN